MKEKIKVPKAPNKKPTTPKPKLGKIADLLKKRPSYVKQIDKNKKKLSEKAKKGKKVVEKRANKLKKGTDAYKKKLAELTTFDFGPSKKAKTKPKPKVAKAAPVKFDDEALGRAGEKNPMGPDSGRKTRDEEGLV